jgi:hypothetical protein
MSDNDLIRRGDALEICTDYGFSRADECRDAIAALPARGVGVPQIVFDQLNVTVGEVGLEMVQDAEDAEFTGERPDLLDYQVSIPYEHAVAILAALEPAPTAADARSTTEKGGDAHAFGSRHAPHEASPGVTAGADAAQVRKAALREAAAVVTSALDDAGDHPTAIGLRAVYADLANRILALIGEKPREQRE